SKFRPVSRLSTVTRLLLAVTLVVDAAAAANLGATSLLLRRLGAGKTGAAHTVLASLHRDVIIGTAQLGLFPITGLVFVLWLRRAYRNLDSLGLPRRHRSLWTVLAWFVPVGGFILLRRIMGDLCGAGGSGRRASIWAGLLFASNLIAGVAFRIGTHSSSPQAVQHAFVMFTAADGFAVVAAFVALTLVRSVSTTQSAPSLAA
ncbi:MAG TPA: DUF4328 domain-containing protein, partial [Gaiellaceae bacterium]|nr:DUF4328 domain-containing protein [Gaiellaceae bacterium]